MTNANTYPSFSLFLKQALTLSSHRPAPAGASSASDPKPFQRADTHHRRAARLLVSFREAFGWLRARAQVAKNGCLLTTLLARRDARYPEPRP